MTDSESHDWAAQLSDHPIVNTVTTVTGNLPPSVAIQFDTGDHDPYGGTSVPDDRHRHDLTPHAGVIDEQIFLSRKEQMIHLADQQNLQWLRSRVDSYDYLFITVTFKSDSTDGSLFLSLFDGWLSNRINVLIRGRTRTMNARLVKPMTIMREFECHSDHRINCPAHIHAIVGVPKHAASLRRLRVHLPKAIKTKSIIHDIDIQQCAPSDLARRYWYMRKSHRRDFPFTGTRRP